MVICDGRFANLCTSVLQRHIVAGMVVGRCEPIGEPISVPIVQVFYVCQCLFYCDRRILQQHLSYDLPCCVFGYRMLICTIFGHASVKFFFEIFLIAGPRRHTKPLGQGSGPLLRPWHAMVSIAREELFSHRLLLT